HVVHAISIDEVGEYEDAEHGEGNRNLNERAEDEPEPRADADAPRILHASVHRELACDCTDERPQDQPWQAEENADDRTDEGAPDGTAARADPLGAHG